MHRQDQSDMERNLTLWKKWQVRPRRATSYGLRRCSTAKIISTDSLAKPDVEIASSSFVAAAGLLLGRCFLLIITIGSCGVAAAEVWLDTR